MEGELEALFMSTGLSIKEEPIQVSTLLTVIGSSAMRVFATFQFEPAEDQNKINAVLVWGLLLTQIKYTIWKV